MRNCTLTVVKFISLIYGKCANKHCMALALVCCSIEANQRGTVYDRARVNLVSWEEGSHTMFFMVPLGDLGARSMA